MTNRSTTRGSPGAMSAGVQADRHAPKQAAITPSRTTARWRRTLPTGGRDAPAHARALPRPLVGEHGEAHVIAPAAGDLHVTPRVTLTHEADARDERKRAAVRRLHVRLDAMQLQRAEGVIEREHERFAHVAVTDERSERVVADVRALERAADDLGEVDDVGERVVVVAQDHEARMPHARVE